MIDQIIVMHVSGLSLYVWQSGEKEKTDPSLISGFLSALNMFAEEQRGEQIKKITLSPTTYIFERFKELVFVILTDDIQYEKIISKILMEIKDEFLKKFEKIIPEFRGEIDTFRSFDNDLNKILESYGYNEYIEVKKYFEKESSINSLILIGTYGEFLYVQSKQYLDRNALGFQSSILLKATSRVVEEIFKEEIVALFTISEKKRNIILKNNPKIVLVLDHMLLDINNNLLFEPNLKKIKNFLKKPDQFFDSNISNIVAFSDNGKEILNLDKENKLKSQKILADSVTILTSSRNMIRDIYKEKFMTVIIVSNKKIYAITKISEINFLISLSNAESEEYSNIFQNIRNFKIVEKQDTDNIIKLVGKVQEFRVLFQ